MSGVRTRKVLLAAVLVLITVVLCSCGQMTTRELPLEKRLNEDVQAYLRTLADSDVALYSLAVDSRDYNEADGTLSYGCTVKFAWDAFSDSDTSRLVVHYALRGGEWTLASVENDIDLEGLNSRIVMHPLYTDTVDMPGVVKAALSGADAVLSGELLDFTAELEGVVYSFPCDYTDFTMNGWEIAADSDLTALDTVAPQSYVSVELVRDTQTISLIIANQTGDTAYLGESECAGFVLRSADAAVLLPSGITAQSSAAEVLAAFGDPDADETTPDGRRLTYQAAANSRVSFLFTADGTQIEYFTLEAPATTLDRAALFDRYKFAFTLDGVEYSLPARLDTWLNNGWTINGTARSDDVIRWYDVRTLTLTKNDESVDVTVRNPSMGDLRLYAASVTGVTLDPGRAAYTLVDRYGKNIGMNQTADAVIAALGTPSRTNTAGDTRIVTYAGDNGLYLRLTFMPAVTIAELQAAEADETAAKTLDALALQIGLGEDTFILPAAASAFEDQMWAPESGWQQPMQAGSFVRMILEDRRAEGITAYLMNTGGETAALQDGVIAGLYAGPGDAGMIVGGSLGEGVSISEAYNSFGIPTYDIWDGDTHYLVYGTSVSRFLCVRCADERVDALWIISFTCQ